MSKHNHALIIFLLADLLPSLASVAPHSCFSSTLSAFPFSISFVSSFSSPHLLTLDLANIPFLGEHLQDLPHSSNTVLKKFIPHIWQFYLVQWQENVFFGPLSLFCWASYKLYNPLFSQDYSISLFLFNVAICRHLMFICFVTLT